MDFWRSVSLNDRGRVKTCFSAKNGLAQSEFLRFAGVLSLKTGQISAKIELTDLASEFSHRLDPKRTSRLSSVGEHREDTARARIKSGGR